MDVRTADRSSSAFFLAVALIVCWASFRLSIGTLEQPGSGFFPFLGGAALAVLSAANLVKALRSSGKDPGLGSTTRSINWKNILLSLAVLAAFPLLLEVLGFAPTTFLFFLLLLRVIEPQRWVVTLGFSFLAAVFFHLLFQVWIKMKFPVGVFGI
jgi:putative tricarboxylic transport membrane protein